MLESFFIENHPKEVDAQWRQKTLVSCEILGKAALRYLRPEVTGDRSRLDLMWNGKALGIRGRSKSDGSHDFYAVSEPDTTTPIISEMMRQVGQSAMPLKQAQLRFRSGILGERGLWIDTSNEQIKALLEEGKWLRSFLDRGWCIEVGQRQKRVVAFEESVKISEPKPEAWLAAYDVQNREIPLKSYISLFSQPGSEANRALIATGFDLLDRAGVGADISWIEWGAGYGNLSAAYASRLGPRGFASEMEAAAALLLEQNAQKFFPGVRTECRAAEKLLPNDSEKFQLWLVDPPRPGFGKLLESLAESSAKPQWVLAYHCHASGLIADVRALKNAGFALLDWSSVDVFPATSHHEVISLWKLK